MRPSPRAAVSTADSWLGHPKGVYLVAFTELWERFSYFGMTALMVLFLTGDPADGGWGWARDDAIFFFSFYTGLVFVVPVAGAWLANNYLGERKCILFGAILLVTGHVLLGGLTFVPLLVRTITMQDAVAVIEVSGFPQGRLWALDDAAAAFADVVTTQGLDVADARTLLSAAIWTYGLSSASFLLGLALIVVATGLFKAPIASIVSKLYPRADAHRDGGYALFLTFIYIGAVMANLIAGGIGERYGWHFGFAAAAAGATIALCVYLSKESEYLGTIGIVPDARRGQPSGESPEPALVLVERDHLGVLMLQGLFTTIYAAGFYQKGGLLTLYSRDHVDRVVGGFELPATWLLSVSTIVFMIVTPLLAAVAIKLERDHRNPPASYKLATGLGLIGLAYVLLGLAESDRQLAGQASIASAWLIGSYVLFGISDALVWPNQMALVTRLSPKRYGTMVLGAWQLTVGVGTWLAGIIGMAVDEVGNLSVFWGLALLCVGSGFFVVMLSPKMLAMMHDGKTQAAPSIHDVTRVRPP